MATLYSTTATATGGRAGRVATDDGMVELNLAMPEGLGGTGGATNPEQLFACGYAACFGNAIIHIGRKPHGIADTDVTVKATVGLRQIEGGGFGLTVALDVTIAGVDRETAETLTREAHRICPYSNAIRGNVDVELSATAG